MGIVYIFVDIGSVLHPLIDFGLPPFKRRLGFDSPDLGEIVGPFIDFFQADSDCQLLRYLQGLIPSSGCSGSVLYYLCLRMFC